MMEWVEAETREATADGSCFFSVSLPLLPPQTFGELYSKVTLLICLKIPDCRIASSRGSTTGSLGSSMF